MIVFILLMALSLVPAAHAADGALDPTFGTAGKVQTSFLGAASKGQAVAIQTDGKIVVAGPASNIDGSNRANFTLVRYNTDGSLDSTFGPGGGGIAVTLNTGNDVAFAVAIQAVTGKIAVAGSSGSDFAVALFNADGTLDTTFGPTGTKPGMVITSISTRSDVARGVAFQADGKIVVVGFSNDPNNTGTDNNFDFALVRHNPNGALDATFGTAGKVTTDFSGARRLDKGYAVAIQADGTILVAGESKGDFALARYTSAGVLINTVTTDFGGTDAAYAIALQSDGKIVLAGEAQVIDSGTSLNCVNSKQKRCQYLDFALARYTATGVLDTTFGSGGKVTTNISARGNDDQARGVAIQADGKIVVAGSTETSIHTYSSDGDETGPTRIFDFAVVRYTTAGAVDTTFGTAGKTTTNFGNPQEVNGNAIAIQADGKSVVAGIFKSTGAGIQNLGFAVARYDAQIRTMLVSPATGITASGPAGGPFTPASFQYKLDATLGGNMAFAISGVPTWLTASATSGTVVSISGTTITFTVNASAATLAPNTYTSIITFTNATDGVGTTTRSATLTVTGQARTLVVSPATGITASGPAGGPFTPTTFQYTLNATQGGSVAFAISGLPTWLTASATSGNVLSITGTTVTFTVNASAATLAPNTYTSIITFTNATDGVGTTTRSATLTVAPSTTFDLTVARAGKGNGTVTGTGINCGSDCTEPYAGGTSINLIATPAAGNSFAGWSGDCASFGTQPVCTLNMTSVKVAVATFNVGSESGRNNVQKAYVAYYGRAADPAGLDYWATQLDAAGSLNAIIVPFGNSKEFITRYGGLTNTQLVTKIYQQALARDPDQGGLDYYVGELSAGRRSLQSITLDVVFGATTPPDSTVVANKLDVAAYYTAKVAAGCPYGSELDGVNALVGVTSNPASVTGAKSGINFRCAP